MREKKRERERGQRQSEREKEIEKDRGKKECVLVKVFSFKSLAEEGFKKFHTFHFLIKMMNVDQKMESMKFLDSLLCQ